jgi:hypothetical protein
VLAGTASYVVREAEPMTWYVACYDTNGKPTALAPCSAHIELVTATPFS